MWYADKRPSLRMMVTATGLIVWRIEWDAYRDRRSDRDWYTRRNKSYRDWLVRRVQFWGTHSDSQSRDCRWWSHSLKFPLTSS